MKRIVKEVLADGTVQFRVEKKTMFLGWTLHDWHTDTVYHEGKDGFGNLYDAVFSTFAEAQAHCGIDPNPVRFKEEVFTDREPTPDYELPEPERWEDMTGAIKIEYTERYGWCVYQNGKVSSRLCWDEMIATVIGLTNEIRPFLGHKSWMK